MAVAPTSHSPLEKQTFHKSGFELIRSVVPHATCNALLDVLDGEFKRVAQQSRHRIGGLRNLLQSHPEVTALATSPEFLNLLLSWLGENSFPVNATFFDKTTVSNWRVPWHQDLMIAVDKRLDMPGYCGWSEKDGVIYVNPPSQVLERMTTIRLHLDDCPTANGPLRVIPGSHLAGKLEQDAIDACVARNNAITCEANKGDVLLMRPLLLHASSPAQAPIHRRILHIDYSTVQLAEGLNWSFQS